MSLRLVMAGAVEFSRACLKALVAARAPLQGVVALPPAAAARHSDYADLGAAAREAGLPAHETKDVNDPDALAAVRAWAPDVLLILGWSQLLRSEALSLAPMGTIGSHPALLPRNRGRHPIVWQLIHGETESGLTLFWLDATADGGPILLQERFPLDPDDDAADFYRKMTEAGVRMMPEMVRLLEGGSPPRVPQDESRSTTLRKRTAEDGWVDWSRPSADIHNLIRALARPYVGASTRAGDTEVKLWRARRHSLPVPPAAPGTVLSTAPLRVRTGDGAVDVLESDPPPDRFPAGFAFGSRA